MAEWPPHPARLFAALAAAHFEGQGTAAEREFLLWLERQGSPELTASPAEFRLATTSYVPVNDVRQADVLPDRRLRQSRSFPTAFPHEPTVWFIWPDADLDARLDEACRSLTARVAYLGHSSSLVHVRRVHQPPPATHRPGDSGQALRVPSPGQLEAFERAFRVFEETGVRGRLPSGFQAYTRTHDDEPPRLGPRTGVFGDLVAFRRRRGPSLPLTAAVGVARALRGAVMAACPEPLPEVISGHRPDGRPSERPHVAYVALPFVTPPWARHRHADGRLVGVAAVLPRDLDGEELVRALRALGRVERLTLGAAGAWEVERVGPDPPQRTLRPETWAGPASSWATATPIVLDRFPDRPYGDEAATTVALACVRTGLPEPTEVRVGPTSALLGSEPWHRFLPPGEGRPRRPLVHAVLRFAEPVLGPLLLGSGRYYGLGLCRPLA